MVSMRSSERILSFVKETGLTEGDQLPAEVDMARELGMSRNSIREAYAKLTARGVLVRKHGIGTFIAKVPIVNDFGHRRGFWRMIEASGYRASMRIVSQGEVRADHELAVHIAVPGKGRLTQFEWLFLADDHPVIFIQHVLAPTLRIEGIDWLKSHNLLAALADQIDPAEAELEVHNTAVNADPDLARHLEVPVGTALLHGLSKVHAGSGRIPIVSRHWSNPEYTTISQRQPITEEQFAI